MVRHIAKYTIYPKQKNFHWDILGEHIDWEDPVVEAVCIIRAEAYVQAIERRLKDKILYENIME